MPRQPVSHRCGPRIAAAATICVAALAAAADPGARYPYLPPAISPRVVFYHSFSHGPDTPEINRINARIRAGKTAPVAGLTGPGFRCPAPDAQKPFLLESPGLGVDRPITVMLWWRLDRPMTETSGFNVLTLRGKGLIGSFVRGKGKWCGLKEPRRIFQVYYFPGIANRNDISSEKVLLIDPVWHHTAMTVAAAGEIRVYWDGERKTSYAIKGRPFRPGDVNLAVLGRQHGAQPMSLDEIVVLDRVLDAAEIQAYVSAVRKLAERDFPFRETAP